MVKIYQSMQKTGSKGDFLVKIFKDFSQNQGSMVQWPLFIEQKIGNDMVFFRCRKGEHYLLGIFFLAPRKLTHTNNSRRVWKTAKWFCKKISLVTTGYVATNID